MASTWKWKARGAGKRWELAHLVDEGANRTECGQGISGLELIEAPEGTSRCARCWAKVVNGNAPVKTETVFDRRGRAVGQRLLQTKVVPGTQRTRYTLMPDDCGHWYVVPVEKVAEFAAWASSEEGEEAPEWADRINGSLRLLTFTDYEIER